MEMANAGVGLGDALMLAKQGSNGNEMWNNPFVYSIKITPNFKQNAWVRGFFA